MSPRVTSLVALQEMVMEEVAEVPGMRTRMVGTAHRQPPSWFLCHLHSVGMQMWVWCFKLRRQELCLHLKVLAGDMVALGRPCTGKRHVSLTN
jgi:hypothetical protein